MAHDFIDADTHIVEDEAVWSHIPTADRDVMPRVLKMEPDKARPDTWAPEFFQVDGELYRKGGQQLIVYKDGTRTFTDPEARLEAMDELGIGVQVIYTSIFLGLATKSPRTELVLARSWNSWMGDVCAASNGRFRYVAVPSTKNVEETVKDMKRWRANGACGLMMRCYENDKTMVHKDYWPIYAEAQELDLPICIHIGQGSRAMKTIETTSNGISVALPNLIAFGAIMNSEVPNMFPKLKFGFIESGASWIDFAISRGNRYREVYGVPSHAEQMLADGRLFITAEAHEDIGALVAKVGPDALLLGTDYGHSDTSTELGAHALFMERSDISQDVARRICVDNSRRFYGL
jgi:predicted TIM-barrel fold metal-dependent hydrolase